MYAAGNITGKEYVVCLYARLSLEDGDVSGSTYKAEIRSITTQWALLHDYIRSRKEFDGCRIVKKCDDVFSGTHFDNRPQFMEIFYIFHMAMARRIVFKRCVNIFKVHIFNETDINPPAELGRLTDASGDEQSTKI